MSARDEIDRLLFAATVDGVAHLPTLTDDQLCVLSAGQWPLLQVEVWTSWAALDPGVRFERGEAALRQLQAAGHVTSWEHDAHGWRVQAAPALALVPSARRSPSYAAFGAGLGQGNDVRAPRVFGIGASDAAEHLVLVELVHGTSHAHRLMSPTRVARSLAEWATTCVSSDAMGQRVDAVGILLFRPAAGPETAWPQPGAYAVRVAASPDSGASGRVELDARTPSGRRIAQPSASATDVADAIASVCETAAPAALRA